MTDAQVRSIWAREWLAACQTIPLLDAPYVSDRLKGIPAVVIRA